MPPDATVLPGELPGDGFSFWGLRDRLVARPGFRAWAARFPLTRPIARARTRDLFDLCAGFVYAQILQACVELRLFALLADGPKSLAALAARMEMSPAAAATLLDGAVALRLLARRRPGYGLGKLGAAMVGNEAVESMVAHHARLYADLADPVALLRGQNRPTRLQEYWAYAGAAAPSDASDDAVAAYTHLMAASQALVSAEILDAFPLRRFTCLLDVGGGDGTFLRAAGARTPGLRLRLFDLPAVAARAAAKFAAGPLATRAEIFGGSFITDPLPQGADVISLVRVVHDHDDRVVRPLLEAAWRALPPGGALLLAEPMAETPGAGRMGHAYFGFYLLAMGSGRPRSASVLTATLKEAGFARVQRVPTHTPLLTSVLVAWKA